MKTKDLLLFALLFGLFITEANAQRRTVDEKFPVRGLAIQAPSVQGLDNFIKFIETELAPARFNLLILRVEYNYAYESHPELRAQQTLSKDDVKKIVNVCKKHNIQIAPQINLLGHQSWQSTIGNLLKVYPEFDETPHVKLPEKLDEVFYIGDDKCPRCSGRDKAELFAGEIIKINQHLAKRDGRLYIWGDRKPITDRLRMPPV